MISLEKLIPEIINSPIVQYASVGLFAFASVYLCSKEQKDADKESKGFNKDLHKIIYKENNGS
jgi:hypothetical protein